MGDREVDSKCGIFVAHSLHDVYNGLVSLQHRGQDSTGIACLVNEKNFPYKSYIDILRWEGKVRDFSLETASRILDGGILFIGEVRYSTNKGKTKKELFEGALPRYFGENSKITKYDSPRHRHIIIRNADCALVHNGNLIEVSPGENKTDSDILLEFYIKNGIEKTIKFFPAAYSVAILDFKKENVIIFKDRYGIRPLFIGVKDGRLIAGSEDISLVNIGGNPIRELLPGEEIEIPMNGTNFKSNIILSKSPRPCFFERHYLGNPLSSFGGITNKNTRFRLGEILAKEFSPKVDFVSYIPNSPEDVARGYAESLNLPLVNIFYKLSNDRSFLNATKSERCNSIGNNLYVRDNVNIRDSRILVCDDSIVRFNNAPDAAKKLREAGAKYLALVVATPLIGPEIDGIKHYCPFGVDMPKNDDFFSRKFSSNSNRIFSEGSFDEIYFISKEGMEIADRIKLNECCAFCIGEENPVNDIELEKLVELNLS